MKVNRKSEACGVENLYLWFQSSLSKTSHMPSENSTMLSLTFEMGLGKELPVWYKHINRKWKEVWASGEKHSRLGCCIQAAVAHSVKECGRTQSMAPLQASSLSGWFGEWAQKNLCCLLPVCVFRQSPHPLPLCSICVRKAGRGSWVRWGTESRLQEERGAISFLYYKLCKLQSFF